MSVFTHPNISVTSGIQKSNDRKKALQTLIQTDKEELEAHKAMIKAYQSDVIQGNRPAIKEGILKKPLKKDTVTVRQTAGRARIKDTRQASVR